MKLGRISVALCVAAAVTSLSSYGSDHRQESRKDRPPRSALQAVTVAAKAGEPGHGWQYFSDARRKRSVVISPGGDYYYSHGDGLAMVFKANPAA